VDPADGRVTTGEQILYALVAFDVVLDAVLFALDVVILIVVVIIVLVADLSKNFLKSNAILKTFIVV